MKKMVLALISCIALLCPALPAFAVDAAGVVKTVRGQVRIERGSRNLDARVGDAIHEGDRLVSDKDSSIGVSMKDETLLSIGPNSTLVIDKYAYDPVTRAGEVSTKIVKGTLRYVTGLIGKLHPQAIKVTTANATIGIRGTDFIVEVPVEE